MTEKRADELVRGDLILLKGDRYTVTRAKVRGKHVRLSIDGRRGSFTDEVKARQVYDVVVPADGDSSLSTERASKNRSSTGRGSAQVRGPLLSPTGAQTRWAGASEASDLLEPSETVGTTGWDESASKAEKRLTDRLGARLVGVEVEGGRLVVPPVDDSTLFGHLLTMHKVRWDGVTFEEARAWARKNNVAGPESATQVVDALSVQRATELHESLHANLADMPRPHFHRERAPR